MRGVTVFVILAVVLVACAGPTVTDQSSTSQTPTSVATTLTPTTEAGPGWPSGSLRHTLEEFQEEWATRDLETQASFHEEYEGLFLDDEPIVEPAYGSYESSTYDLMDGAVRLRLVYDPVDRYLYALEYEIEDLTVFVQSWTIGYLCEVMFSPDPPDGVIAGDCYPTEELYPGDVAYADRVPIWMDPTRMGVDFDRDVWVVTMDGKSVRMATFAVDAPIRGDIEAELAARPQPPTLSYPDFEVPEGFEFVDRSEYGYGIALPTGSVVFDPSALYPDLVDGTADFPPEQGQVFIDLAIQGVSLISADPGSFLTVGVVDAIRKDGDDVASLQEGVDAFVDSTGGTLVSSEQVSINGLDGLLIVYEQPLPQGTAINYRYTLFTDLNAFVITLTTLDSDSVEDTFASIIDTFVVLSG